MANNLKQKDAKETERQKVINVLNQLQSGESFDFQFDAIGKERLKCKLVGIHETSYFAFAIHSYARKGYDDFITNNRPCILRTIIERDSGLYIGFKSTITSVIKNLTLFFVDYPTAIERFSLRTEIRLPTHAPASLMPKESSNDPLNITYHGLIIDLSTTGCRFKLPWSVSNDACDLKEVFVKITFPSKPDSPLTVKSQLKSNTHYDKEHISLGIKLEGTSELQKLFSRIGLNS